MIVLLCLKDRRLTGCRQKILDTLTVGRCDAFPGRLNGLLRYARNDEKPKTTIASVAKQSIVRISLVSPQKERGE
jgi:hypothetical protein